MCRQEYGACETCSAKWFSPAPLSRCPRCGSPHVLNTTAIPPWKTARDSRPRVEERATEENAETEAES